MYMHMISVFLGPSLIGRLFPEMKDLLGPPGRVDALHSGWWDSSDSFDLRFPVDCIENPFSSPWSRFIISMTCIPSSLLLWKSPTPTEAFILYPCQQFVSTTHEKSFPYALANLFFLSTFPGPLSFSRPTVSVLQIFRSVVSFTFSLSFFLKTMPSFNFI